MLEHKSEQGTYARSKLPGGLAAEAEVAADMHDNFIQEAHLSTGTGICLTERSLIVVQGGILKVGLPTFRRSALFALGMITNISLEHDKSKEGQFSLRLSISDPDAPDWALKLPVTKEKVARAFRFAKYFWLQTHELHADPGNPPPPLRACPHCRSPLVEYREG